MWAMKMGVRGRRKVKVICDKIFLFEKIVLNDCFSIPKNPRVFMSSSVRSMVVFVFGFCWLVGGEDEDEYIGVYDEWVLTVV